MDALDPSQFGLAPAAPPAGAPPSFPIVPAHPAPDNSGAMTNLSDADYAKFMRGESPAASGGAPQQTQQPKQLDPEKFGLTAAPAAQPAQPTAKPEAPQQSFPASFAGSLTATLAGIPRGIVGGKTDDYLNAAGMTPLNMLLGWQGPGAAFDQSLKEIQGQNQDLASKYPQASTAGELTGALAGGAAAAPALGWESAVGLLPKVGAAASYLGRNAGFGSLMSMANGGDATTGAAIGSLFPALHMAGAGMVAPFSWATRQFAPLFSNAAREQSVGNVLNRTAGGLPIESSSVGPLDLAQATNNPEIAARVGLAPSFNAEANAATRGAQQQAVTDQIAKIGTPATAADASAAFTDALRNARSIAGSEENRLWTVPELAKQTVTPSPVQHAVNGAVSDMEPVLRDSMSPRLKALVSRLNRSGPTTMRDLNGVRSDLMQIARTTSDSAERSMANTLSDAFMDGMDHVPEIAGAPNGLPTGNTVLARDSLGILRPTPEISAPIQPNPKIAQAWQAARDYTRQMRTMFGEPDAAALLKKNAGIFTRDPSEGAAKFFNFSNGSPEGPRSIAQLSDFVSALKQQSLAAPISQQLRDSARSYVAAALTKTSKVAEGQNLNPKLMQDFLRTNGAWMKSSGLFSKPQIEAADQLMDYAGMLRRPEQLLRQVNSSTQARQARSATFIDQIMNPWARRLIELGGVLGGHHGGGMIGAGAGIAGGAAFEHAVGHAEGAMREMMAEALMNPRIAQDLMMKASAANRALMAPETRQLLDTLRAAIGSDVLPQFNAPAATSSAPTPAQ